MSSPRLAHVAPKASRPKAVSRPKALPTQSQSKPLISRSTSDSSKNLAALFAKVAEEITSTDLQYRFTMHATPHFKENHIENHLRREDRSVPEVNQLLFSVQLLAWEDEKKAAFLEAILRDMEHDKLADEIAEFREDLTGECMALGSLDIRIDSKCVPNASEERRQAGLKNAFRITSRLIGDNGQMLLCSLSLSPSAIADYEKPRGSTEEKCYHSLTTWMQKQGKNATLDLLKEALRDVERQDIVDAISRFECQNDGSSSCQSFVSHQTPFSIPVRAVVSSQRPGLGTKEITSLSPQQVPVAESSSFRHSKSDVKPSVVVARQLKKARASSLKGTADQETTHKVSPKKWSTPAGASQISDRDESTSAPQQPSTAPPVNPRKAKCLRRQSEGIPKKAAQCVGYRKEDVVIDMSRSDEQPSLYREMLERANELPERNRHVQIIAVGQTGVGKTNSINNVLGTISAPSTRPSSRGTVGGPRGKSTTDEVVTRTRQLQDGKLFQLSFTDTPGFGDSRNKFSDDQICSALKEAVIDKAEVIILYFAKADEQQHSLHIKSIQKIQEALKRDISGVVCTRAATKPGFATTWEDHAPEIKKNWSNGKLRNIFLEEMVSKGKHADEKSFRDFENSSSWDASSKELILELFWRQERHRGIKKWFRKELKQPKLPVLMLENRERANDRSSRFGIKKFHQRLTKMLSEISQITFSLLTSEDTIAIEDVRLLRFAKVSCRDGTLTDCFPMKHPEDTSSPKTKSERKESNRSLWKRLIEWIKSFFSKKKEDDTCQ
eukprot:m.88542 g.88542  ORF g.88542 m.88542 type:complete len:781 (+) comp36581_c0_seq9:261-2603(+)